MSEFTYYYKKTYKSQLMGGGYFNSKAPGNLEKVGKWDAHAVALTLRVAEALTQFMPQGIPESLWGKLNEREFLSMLQEVFKKSLTYGHCFVSTFDEEPWFRVATPREVKQAILGKKGRVEKVRVEYQVKYEGASVDFNEWWEVGETCYIVYYNRDSLSASGESILIPAWEAMARYASCFENMAHYAGRNGSGIPWVNTTGANMTPEQLSSLQNNMNNLNSTYGGFGPGKLEFAGGAGVAVDWEVILEECRNLVVTASGFSKNWFNGERVASLGNGEDPEKDKDYRRLMDIFGNFTGFIRRFIRSEYNAEVGELLPSLAQQDASVPEESPTALETIEGEMENGRKSAD